MGCFLTDLLTSKLAERLKQLRQDQGWSLSQLAEQSGVSTATLSRLENAEVSPTTEVLGKLCSAYALTLTRLLSMVEEGYVPLIHRQDQSEWVDQKSGFTRRSISPPAQQLSAEVLECELKTNSCLTYNQPSVPGLEHHLFLLEGQLEMTIEGRKHVLNAGDCLRYQLFGASEFRTPKDSAAKYILVLI
jgi:transcriptional regulator with XRE-family HTH domain